MQLITLLLCQMVLNKERSLKQIRPKTGMAQWSILYGQCGVYIEMHSIMFLSHYKDKIMVP